MRRLGAVAKLARIGTRIESDIGVCMHHLL